MVDAITRHAVLRFTGNAEELAGALGMYVLLHELGWRPIVLMHSKATVRKYEEILGLRIREVFPAVGPYADRSTAYVIAKSAPNFWRVVSGEDKSLTRSQRKHIGAPHG